MSGRPKWQNLFAMTISEQKSQLRRAMLAQRAVESPAQKQKIAQEILSRLLCSEPFCSAETVFTYCSVNDEIDTRAFMRACLDQGKVLCVPRCEKERGLMTARRIHTETELCPGKYGIPEPSANADCVSPEKIDLCIVPCLAIDLSGRRLGYGGGYYDRFLRLVLGKTAALCAESRIMRAIPHDAFDVPCDLIYTERRILICEKK